MKNSLSIVILVITGFILTSRHAYSQESEEIEIQREQLDLGKVDLGFGVVQSRYTTTASTATISSDVLEQRAAINLQDAFYGRLLGLTTLKSSGDQGGWVGGGSYGAFYNIRGIQTMSESGDYNSDRNNILVLVDGFPRTIDRLSVDEIESITVLKDAAAIALYGYTGINGILSVKTKRGTQASKGLVINAKYNHKFTYGAELPEYVNAYTYALAMNEARNNGGLTPSYNQFELNAFNSGNYPHLYANVDWEKETLRNMGSEDQFNVSFSNSSDKVSFFSMLNYVNSQGLLTGTETNRGYSTQLKYSKANIRTNLDVQLTSTTAFEANVFASLFESNRPSGISASGLFSTLNFLPAAAFPVRTQDNVWGQTSAFQLLGFTNPVAGIQETGYYRNIGALVNLDFKLKQSLEAFVEGLSVTGRFAYDAWNNSYENRNRGYAWANERFRFDANGQPATGDNNIIRQSGGAATNQLTFTRGSSSQSRNISFILSSDYERKIDEHNLAASLIFHRASSVNSGRYTTFYRSSFMGHVHYDYAGKYIADAVLAFAGSNRSYPQSWSFSPTVSLGWIISNEDFLKESNFINFLKLRGSYGMLHSDYVPMNGMISMNLYNGSSGTFPMTNLQGAFGGTSGLRQSFMPTDDFKLERANKFNLGLDAQLLNSFDLTFEAYYQRRSNILMSENGLYVSMLGVIPGYGNHGIVDSKGIEIGLDYNNTLGDLHVNLGGMITYGVNKIVECVETPKPYSWLELKGKPVDAIRGLETVGFFNDQNDITNSPTQEFANVSPGDIKYKVQKGDNTVNDFDYVPIGYSNVLPEINYAFHAGLEFRGIGFNIVFQGASHYNQWDQFTMPLVMGRNISSDYYQNRWVSGQNNSNAKYPALTTSENINNRQNSTLWLRDASFLKLRNCEVYYKFPESMRTKYFSDVKLSVRGENLYTWSPYNGIDPEMAQLGYPMLKGISVGLSITF